MEFGGVRVVGVEMCRCLASASTVKVSYAWLLTEFRIWRGVKSDVSDGQG